MQVASARSSLEAKADSLASKYYRAITPYCQARGLWPHVCEYRLEWAHIEGRRYHSLRYQPYGHLILCMVAHSYFTEHPSEWREFVSEHFPEKWTLCQANKQRVTKANEAYYRYWIEIFKN